jgi:hypothetical protein
MLNLFHGIRLVTKILTASLFLLFSGCSSDSLSNGDDMSFAKSATGSLLSKAGLSVQMQDDFDGRAQNFTVQFFVSNRTGYIAPSVPPNPIIPPPIAAGNITPVGEILWSIGGNTQRRLVSIYDGIAITGVAEHFAISATDDTDLSDNTNQTLYDVTITAAGGVRGSTSLPPIYQTYIEDNNTGNIAYGTFTLAPTKQLVLVIPQNAGINSVMVTAGSSGTVLTDTDFAFTQSNGSGELKRYNPTVYSFVPLSPQATFITFKNLTAAIGGVSIDFSVTWGIDG